MIQAIAIDDEPLALEVIEGHASKVSFLNLVGSFTDPVEGIEVCNRESISSIFLDIKMHNISGLELAELIPINTKIIFTTAYPDYAVKGFELNAVDYLLKPVSFTRFLKACHKLKNQIDLKQPDVVLFIKDGSQIVRVKSSEVYFIEATGNYLKLYTSKGPIMHRQTVKEFIDVLPDAIFIRIHKSYIVNIEHISRIEPFQLTVDNQTVPLSPNYKEEVWNKLGINRSERK